ncbi:MAG TPA: hypothetical protein VJ952_01555 [Opitutales bacterium]|nr:hypothetical protein [Opitutales bacterium]
MKTTIYLSSFLLLAGFGALPAADQETKVAKGEELVEKRTEREERPGWFERIFGAQRDRAENEEGEGRESDKEKNKSDKASTQGARGFSDKERAVLEDWQRGEASWKKSGKRLPPGLQKKVARGGELPPGWKKKLAVGDKLPEEYESEASSLPEEILKRLPETPKGTEIIRIGDEVIRVVENTREIIDILGIGQGQPQD